MLSLRQGPISFLPAWRLPNFSFGLRKYREVFKTPWRFPGNIIISRLALLLGTSLFHKTSSACPVRYQSRDVTCVTFSIFNHPCPSNGNSCLQSQLEIFSPCSLGSRRLSVPSWLLQLKFGILEIFEPAKVRAISFCRR